MKVLFPVVLASVLILNAVPSHAQHQAEIGIDAGWTHLDDFVANANAWRVGFRAGYHIQDWVEIEAQMAGARAGEEIGSVNLKTTLLTGLANGVFNFRTERVVPYGLVGIGVANLQATPGISSFSDFALAWQFGGGARFFFSNNTALRAEVGHLREHTFDTWNGHWSVTGGVTWVFGER
jgi:opacity protein-like surface antigen